MMKEEFEARVDFTVTGNEYSEIEKIYVNGKCDKDEFCKNWVETGGIGRVLKARAEGNIELPYIKRYNNEELIKIVIEQVKKAGEFEKAEKILDYYLPNDNEKSSADKVTFTTCEFNVYGAADFGGSEGIYLNIWIKGKFDDSGREYCDMATFKTLKDDLESMKIMSELGGIINFFLTSFVNKNIESFSTDRERKYWAIERAKRELKNFENKNEGA